MRARLPCLPRKKSPPARERRGERPRDGTTLGDNRTHPERYNPFMDISNTEAWRAIAGFPAYEVSNMGRVRRIVAAKGGRSASDGVLKHGRLHAGHHGVTLYAEGKKFSLKVHRLVLLAFIGDPPPGEPFGAHEDGNPANNALSNLRWSNQVGNLQDRIAHGTELRGQRNGRAKLSEANAREIRARFKARCRVNGAAALAKEFGVTDVAILKIARGVTWSHLVALE